MNTPLNHDPVASPIDRRRRPRRRTARAVGLVAVLALLAPACGDDDGDDTASDDPTTTTAAPTDDTGTDDDQTDEGASTDLAAFCDGAIEGETIFNAGPPVDETGAPTPEGIEEFGAQLEPHITELEENAPEELSLIHI